ncbi:hypothetical protein EVAR_93332_1 [Eumeta japonica]|uniref:Uncharacterized protein n=1 Tax=Eumeta variegata TaxID=151549 RepID=A0A4C1USW9_EUMVA|nr:hypothetical protein EVAR_93332_1 [Eumeta japonica]
MKGTKATRPYVSTRAGDGASSDGEGLFKRKQGARARASAQPAISPINNFRLIRVQGKKSDQTVINSMNGETPSRMFDNGDNLKIIPPPLERFKWERRNGPIKRLVPRKLSSLAQLNLVECELWVHIDRRYYERDDVPGRDLNFIRFLRQGVNGLIRFKPNNSLIDCPQSLFEPGTFRFEGHALTSAIALSNDITRIRKLQRGSVCMLLKKYDCLSIQVKLILPLSKIFICLLVSVCARTERKLQANLNVTECNGNFVQNTAILTESSSPPMKKTHRQPARTKDSANAKTVTAFANFLEPLKESRRENVRTAICHLSSFAFTLTP